MSAISYSQKDIHYLLGIDTSCDDTSVGLVTSNGEILSNVVASQLDQHAPFGGVVPEIAARSHLKALPYVTEQALAPLNGDWRKLSAIAVTCGPGLVGSLLAGLSYAKGLSLSLKKPLLAINHLEAHIASALLSEECPQPPLVALLVSGGHTSLALLQNDGKYLHLGGTRDDACGEAYDKVAKFLGLGYPGGPVVERMAKLSSEPVKFPQPMSDSADLDFSYSGLKTAVVNYARELSARERERELPAIACGFQESALGVLMIKLEKALRETGVKGFVVVGGVAVNRRLRQLAKELAEKLGVSHYIPPAELCTDNGVMVAACARGKLERGEFAELDLAAYPNLELGQRPDDSLFSR
jgi:N6-L-threonylcarbamoyladenine synthase